MRRILKTLFTLVTAIGILLGLPLTAFADDKTDTGTDGFESIIAVNGTFEATTISITHPATFDYILKSEGYVSKPQLSITNNSLSTIKVTVIDMSSTTGGTLTFTDVDDSVYTWEHINLSDSKKYIAMNLFPTGSGWTSPTGYDFSSVATEPLLLGKIKSNTTANIQVNVNAGRAFDQAYTAKANIVFRFNIA